MDTIVGKLYSIALFFSVGLFADTGSLQVRLTDMDHDEIKEVGLGQPFILEVILRGDAASQGDPIIERLSSIHGRRSGYQMNSVNGNATVTYTYQARVDKEGTYKVGPISVGKYHKDSLTIIVGKKNIAVKKKAKKQKASLQFFVDAQDAVIGEKIPCRLRFLYNDSSVLLKHIGQQTIPGLTQLSVEGPFSGEIEIKGKLFNYIEWRWTFIAQKSGKYVIPAYYADYSIKKNNRAFWGGFAQLLDDYDLKRLYSDAVEFVVHNFDDSHFPVCAVGKDITVKASVDSAVAKQSEGLVLRIDITGDKESSLLGISELVGMPEELKWYRSQSIKSADNQECTEFIIQGLKSGDYEIPAQQLCYFDRESRIYIPIKTEPIIISITPLSHQSQGQHMSSVPSIPQEAEARKQLVVDTLPVSQSSWTQEGRFTMIPWSIYILILIMITLVITFSTIMSFLRKIFYSDTLIRRYHTAFDRASRLIIAAEQSRNNRALYQIFIDLLSVRCSISQDQISADRIEHELYNRFVDESLRKRWFLFFRRLEEEAFGQSPDSYDKLLFKQAFEWVALFKKIL